MCYKFAVGEKGMSVEVSMKDQPPDNAGPDAGTESALIAGLRKRDRQACERLVRQYGAPFLHVARRFVGSEADARDVLQDAFLSIFQGIDRFAGDSRLSTWMHRIVVNAALMRLRSRRSKPETSLDDLMPKFKEDGHQVKDTQPWRPSASAELEDKQTRAMVRGAIERLPEMYRTVLLLRDIEELDTEETAQLLGITPGAVKVRLHRARQALRALLEPHFAVAEAEGGATCQ